MLPIPKFRKRENINKGHEYNSKSHRKITTDSKNHEG